MRVRQGTDLARSGSQAFPGAVGSRSGRPAQVARGTSSTGNGRGGGGQYKLSEVGKGSTLNLAAAGISALATTAVTIVITRQFSKPTAGAFFTATSAFLIVASLAGLGTNIGLTYFIARLRSLHEERRIPVIMRAAMTPVVVASIAATILLVIFAGPLSHVLLSSHHAAAEGGGKATPASVAQALRGLALVLPFAGLLNATLGASRGYRDMRPSAVVGQIGVSVGRLMGVLVAVVLGSAALLAPLWAVCYVPAAIAAWWWGRRIRDNRTRRRPAFPDVPPEVAALLALSKPVPSVRSSSTKYARSGAGSRVTRRKLASANARGFWAFTTPRAIANLSSSILQQLDIVLVAAIKGAPAAAVYTAATRFLVLGQLGGMAFNRASQPRFTELFTLGDRKGANVVYQATTTWLVLLLWPLFLLTIVYGPLVLTVFGKSYSAGDGVMVILGLAMLLATVCGQVDIVLITSGRSSWSLINGLLTVGVNIAVDLALIPKYGILGAAIGWAVAIAVNNLMPLAQLAWVLHLHPFGRGTFIACTLTALAFGVIPLAMRSALGNTVIALALGAAAGCALQAAGMWRFRRTLQLSAMSGAIRLRRRGPAKQAR